MIWIDLTHTARTGANTGIQRVSRFLWQHLGNRARGVVFDRAIQRWRTPWPTEAARLRWSSDRAPERRRAARGRWGEKARDQLNRIKRTLGLAPQNESDPMSAEGAPVVVLIPELPHPETRAALLALRHQNPGTRIVTVFHDAAAIALPEHTPRQTVERYPEYLRWLVQVDGVASVSSASQSDLERWWRKSDLLEWPHLRVISLGCPPLPEPVLTPQPERQELELLCVGTLEGRKNHLALLEACERLWADGERFRLRLMGGWNRETGSAARHRIDSLQALDRPLIWEPLPTDQALVDAYVHCDLFVYPSLHEGYGLPVEEALSFGKPCLLTPKGALPERAELGGCYQTRDASVDALEEGLRVLLGNRPLLDRLTREAGERPMRTLIDWADELTEWSQKIPAR